jgi:hypothetical protein
MASIREANTDRATKAQPALAEPMPLDPTLVDSSLRYGQGHAQVESVRLLNSQGASSSAFTFEEHVTVEVAFRAKRDLERLDLVIGLRDRTGVDLFACSAMDEDRDLPPMKAGQLGVTRFTFQNLFKPGSCGISVTLTRRPDNKGDGTIVMDHLETCAAFNSLKPGGTEQATKRQVRFKVQLPVAVETKIDARDVRPVVEGVASGRAAAGLES